MSVDQEIAVSPLPASVERPVPVADDAPAATPEVRGTIAVLVSQFPRIEETFILRELEEVERRGQPLLVVPIVRRRPATIHEEAKPWARRALYVPFLSDGVVRSNLEVFRSDPSRYLRVLAELIAALAAQPLDLIKSLALFPKAVHLARLLPRMSIRHVHAHGATHAATAAWIMAAVSDLTYSFTVYGPDVFVRRSLLRQKMRDAAFVRTVSVFNQAFLTGLYPLVSAGKIKVVQSGLNPEVYEQARAEAVRERHHPRIISVAKAPAGTRGLNFLIEACAELHRRGVELECSIIGGALMREPLHELIEARGLSSSVHLLPPQPQHEVARLIGEADVFVLPSVIAPSGQMDGVPLSLVEALAAGKPVVASAVSGIPEVVRHGVNGLLVDGTHPERIADAVAQLLADESLRARFGRAGQATVRQRFDVRRTSAAVVRLFDRLGFANDIASTAEERVSALDWSSLGAVALGVRKVYERADSSVAEVTYTDGVRKRDVIVRRHRPSRDGSLSARERARTEHDVLALLRHRLGPFGHGRDATIPAVPDVLLFDEKKASTVVARADGKSLAGMINDARFSYGLRRLRRTLPRVGEWLAAMQRVTRKTADGRVLIDSLTENALNDLDLAATAGVPLHRRYDDIAAALVRLGDSVEPLEITGAHGAFSPGEIFVDGPRIEVTGFGGYRDGLPVTDVARFLIELELAFAAPFRGRLLDELREAFLTGWSGGKTVPAMALRLCTIAEALHLLAYAEEQRNPLAAWRRRRLLLRILDRAVRR